MDKAIKPLKSGATSSLSLIHTHDIAASNRFRKFNPGSGQTLPMHPFVLVAVPISQHHLLKQKKARGLMEDRRRNSKLKNRTEE